MLEASFVDPSPVLSNSPLYGLTVDLLLFLHKVALDVSDNTTKQQQAAKVQGVVWQSLHSLCVQYIDITDPSRAYTLQRLSSFLISFKNPIQANKKKARVKFAEEGAANKSKAETPQKKSPSEETKSLSPLLEDGGVVYGVVCRSCRTAFSQSKDFSSKMHLVFFAKLFKQYINTKLLEELYRENYGEDVKLAKSEETCKFFSDVILPWIKECPKCDRQTSECLVDILYGVFEASDTKGKLTILSQFYQVGVFIIINIIIIIIITIVIVIIITIIIIITIVIIIIHIAIIIVIVVIITIIITIAIVIVVIITIIIIIIDVWFKG